MSSIATDLETTGQRNLSKNLVNDRGPEAKEVSSLIDNLPITVFRTSVDSSWAVRYISKNVDVLTGHTKMDFISQKISWSDIVYPEDAPLIEEIVQKAMKNRTAYQVEYRIKKTDGSTVFIQELAHLVNDDAGNLAYIDGVFLDVTPQILRREESQRAIVSSIPQPSLALYVDASGKIKYINDYFVKVCKFKKAEDAIGVSPTDLMESGDKKSLAEKVLESGEAVYNLERPLKLRALDKPLHTVTSSVPIKDDSGAIIGNLTIITDMTEMKEKEKEIAELLHYTNSCLKDLGEGIRRIGEGDLEVHLEKIKDDDFGKTFEEFNQLVANLKSVIEIILADMLTTLEEARQIGRAHV